MTDCLSFIDRLRKSAPHGARRRAIRLAFVAAIVVAFFLRFAWVASQGFVEFDEGWLVDSASSMARHMHGHKREIYIDFKASPATSFIVGLPIAIFGDTPEAIMYPTALAGFLGVLLVSYLAYLMYGTSTALIALLIGAASPMQNLFSRTVALDTPGFLFLALSYLLIIRTPAGQKLTRNSTFLLFVSGISLGLALASNYRALSCILLPSLVIIIGEGVRLATATRLVTHLAGFATSLVTLDLLMGLIYPASKGYFHLLSLQYKHIGGKTFGGATALLPTFYNKDPSNLFLSVIDLDNAITIALAVLWLFALPVLLLRGRYRSSDLQLAVVMVIPFAMFNLLSVTAARGATVAQPFLALAAARFITSLSNSTLFAKSPARNGVIAILVLIPTAFGLYKSIQPDVMGRENPFERAFRETCAKTNTGVITINDSGPSYYARRLNCRWAINHMGTGPLHLLKIHLQGHRFWVIDAQFSEYKRRLDALWPAFEHQSPDLFIPAPSYVRLDHFVEHTVWSGSTYSEARAAYEAWISRWGARLPVFDLDAQIIPLKWKPESKDWYMVGSAIVSAASSADVSNGFRIVWKDSLAGTGARGRFNIHYNILPVEVGLGMCNRSSAERCAGVAVLVSVKISGPEFTIVEISSSGVKELATSTLPPQQIDQTVPLWIRCVGNQITAGFGDKTALGTRSSRACEAGYPALLTRESTALEAYELASDVTN